MALDGLRTGRATAVGAATAIVVGLVVITPAAGFVSPRGALAMGALGAVPSYFAILWRARTRLDDSLDVVAAHGLGGAAGALLTGVFAQKAYTGTTGGLIEGDLRQLGVQALGVVVAATFSGGMTFVLLKAIGLVSPLRATDRDERLGLDITQHGEEAYTRGDGALLLLTKERDKP
jgi:Amt family ammonium transporter